ncbi:hypothetical protein Ahy_B02g061191 [Arachis hypogaea]|uniref:Aminotransferase-like plant mobile domain-containing protein n=1 Tax=Arachis hypogaea TaxID=3818 RepID=A0A445AKA4_ARAHY|nr:hypothetical protein Ahy_B02g061191 [Arachis hypogaea]
MESRILLALSTSSPIAASLALDGNTFEELLGVLPLANYIDKFTVECTWFQETFSELPQGADDETLFGDRLQTHWLPYVARLEDMGQYSWGFAALSWSFKCMCRVANKNIVKLAGPLQLLQS